MPLSAVIHIFFIITMAIVVYKPGPCIKIDSYIYIIAVAFILPGFTAGITGKVGRNGSVIQPYILYAGFIKHLDGERVGIVFQVVYLADTGIYYHLGAHYAGLGGAVDD